MSDCKLPTGCPRVEASQKWCKRDKANTMSREKRGPFLCGTSCRCVSEISHEPHGAQFQCVTSKYLPEVCVTGNRGHGQHAPQLDPFVDTRTLDRRGWEVELMDACARRWTQKQAS